MNRNEFEALEGRVKARSERMWTETGSPEGGPARYMDRARELVAIEEVALPKIDPDRAANPVIEEASIQRNLGEFPTLTDQGEEMTYPDAEAAETLDPYGDDDIRLSDGDASETGGVLPEEEVAAEDMPDVSLADADITTSAPGADDDPQKEDLNDDGMPDAKDLDK